MVKHDAERPEFSVIDSYTFTTGLVHFPHTGQQIKEVISYHELIYIDWSKSAYIKPTLGQNIKSINTINIVGLKLQD